MPLHLSIAPQAKIDVAEIAIYVAQDDPGVGLRFLQAVDDTFQRLAEMPGLGSQLESVHPRLASYKVWPVRGFDNYLIIYRVKPHTLGIVRVLHGARDIAVLLERS